MLKACLGAHSRADANTQVSRNRLLGSATGGFPYFSRGKERVWIRWSGSLLSLACTKNYGFGAREKKLVWIVV